MTLFLSSASATSEPSTDSALELSFGLVHKNSYLIISHDFTKQVLFSLKTLDDVLKRLHTMLLRSSLRSLDSIFCTDFSHVQIFGDHFPNTILIHLKLTYIFISTIATNHPLYLLDVDISSASWKSPAPWVIIHFLTTLFKPLKHSKTRVRVMVLSPYTYISLPRNFL